MSNGGEELGTKAWATTHAEELAKLRAAVLEEARWHLRNERGSNRRALQLARLLVRVGNDQLRAQALLDRLG